MEMAHIEDDSKLVAACISNDPSAWSVLVKKYSSLIRISIENRLFKYGFSLGRQETEEIHQEVLISLWKDHKLENVKNSNNISCWLAVVSGNIAVDHLRQKGFLPSLKLISLDKKIGEGILEELIPSPRLSAIDELNRVEVLGLIEAAVEALPAREKIIAKLSIFHDKKHREIAEMLGLAQGTISSHIKRIKKRLKDSLKNLQ